MPLRLPSRPKLRLQTTLFALMVSLLLPLELMGEEPANQGKDATASTEITLGDLSSGKVRILDLTYTLNSETHYWPGEEYTPFQIETIATLKKDGVYSRKVSFPEHIGTHLDAPNHFEEGQQDVSEIPVEMFIGPGVVIDITLQAEANPDKALSVDDLLEWEKENGPIPSGAIVLLRTGWGKFWTSRVRYQNRDARGELHFPGYSPESARWLIEERKIKGIGIDTMSIDPGISKTFDVHHIINQAGRYGLENVAHLDKLPVRGFTLIVAPIKVEGGTGGPCRIYALLPNDSGTGKN